MEVSFYSWKNKENNLGMIVDGLQETNDTKRRETKWQKEKLNLMQLKNNQRHRKRTLQIVNFLLNLVMVNHPQKGQIGIQN
jgi:hypothetical protein